MNEYPDLSTLEPWEEIGVQVHHQSKDGGESHSWEFGLAHPRVPGLAITMHHFGEFDVTHLGSGKKVAGPFERCGTAGELLVALGHCADWRQDASGLRAQMDATRDEPANMPGFTGTNEHGARPMTKGEVLDAVRQWDESDEFPDEDASPSYRADVALLGLPAALPRALSRSPETSEDGR